MNGLSGLDAIRARHAAASPGPWHWSGQNDSYNGPYLATWTPGSGRTIVMDFVRLGMRRAQPRFNIDNAMVKAVPGLVVQEVTYRKDVESIDHPDAEFIVHSHQDVADLLTEVDRLRLALNERDR